MTVVDLPKLTSIQANAYMHLIGRALAKSRASVFEDGTFDGTIPMLAELTKRPAGQVKQTLNQIMRKGYFDDQDGSFSSELIPRELLQAQGMSVPDEAISIKDLEELATNNTPVQNRKGGKKPVATKRKRKVVKKQPAYIEEEYVEEDFERIRVNDMMNHAQVVKVFELNMQQALEFVIEKDLDGAVVCLADSFEALSHKVLHRHPLYSDFNERFRSGCVLVSCAK